MKFSFIFCFARNRKALFENSGTNWLRLVWRFGEKHVEYPLLKRDTVLHAENVDYAMAA